MPINFTFFTRSKVNLHQLVTDTAMFFGVRWSLLVYNEDVTSRVFTFDRIGFIHKAHTPSCRNKTTVQNYWKMSNQNTKKRPGTEFKLFNCTREIGMDNFGYLNSSLYFYFVTNLRKKFMAYVHLQLNLLPPPIQACTLLAVHGPQPSPSKRRCFRDDPIQDVPFQGCSGWGGGAPKSPST